MKNDIWNSIEDNKFPRQGVWVMAKLDGMRYSDGRSKVNKNEVVIVKLKRGISVKTREAMKSGKIKSPNHGYLDWIEETNTYELKEDKRYLFFCSEDEHGNNLVPYVWEDNYGHYYFGQEIESWRDLPK
jgi:hypothetical protein